MSAAAITVLVEYHIRPENCSMAEWLEIWRPRAEDARDGEPETTAYAACLNTANDDRALQPLPQTPQRDTTA